MRGEPRFISGNRPFDRITGNWNVSILRRPLFPFDGGLIWCRNKHLSSDRGAIFIYDCKLHRPFVFRFISMCARKAAFGAFELELCFQKISLGIRSCPRSLSHLPHQGIVVRIHKNIVGKRF